MASLQTFIHPRHNQPDQLMEFFAVDHSVGRGGRNRIDDVQLIQLLLNRARLQLRRDAEGYRQRWGKDPRMVDTQGAEVGELKVDGLCGAKTLAGILAFQNSVARTNGFHGAVDGRIDAAHGGHDSYNSGGFMNIAGFENGKFTNTRIARQRFRAMYILAVESQGPSAGPLNVLEINVEPLKSALMRSSMNRLKKLGAQLGESAMGGGQG